MAKAFAIGVRASWIECVLYLVLKIERERVRAHIVTCTTLSINVLHRFHLDNDDNADYPWKEECGWKEREWVRERAKEIGETKKPISVSEYISSRNQDVRQMHAHTRLFGPFVVLLARRNALRCITTMNCETNNKTCARITAAGCWLRSKFSDSPFRRCAICRCRKRIRPTHVRVLL